MDFKQHFDIIYNKFIEYALRNGVEHPSKLALGRFLDIGPGRIQAWEKGQWPSAADLATIEKKLGFNLRWLVTGRGLPDDADKTGNEVPPETWPHTTTPENRGNIDRLGELKGQIAELQAANMELVKTLKDTVRELKDAQSESVSWQRECLNLQKQILQAGNSNDIATVTGTHARGAHTTTSDNK